MADRDNRRESSSFGNKFPAAQHMWWRTLIHLLQNAEFGRTKFCTEVEQKSHGRPTCLSVGENSLGTFGPASETGEWEEGEANLILSTETSDKLQSLEEDFLRECEPSQNDLRSLVIFLYTVTSITGRSRKRDMIKY